MGLAITNPLANPYSFFFTAPLVNPPDPVDFPLTISFKSDLHFDGVTTSQGYSVNLTSLTKNLANTDRHGHHLAKIFVATPVVHALTFTSGDVVLDFKVPYLYYDRLSASDTVKVEFNVKITDTIDQTFQNEQVWLVLTGNNDPPTAGDSYLTISNRVTSFVDGRILANSDDPDSHEKLHIVRAHLYGPVMPSPGTVFPPSFKPKPAGTVGHTATAITFHLNPYYHFLTAGQKANFEIQYTISDGHLTSSAFLHVTLKGSGHHHTHTAADHLMLSDNGSGTWLANGGSGDHVSHVDGATAGDWATAAAIDHHQSIAASDWFL